jgi:GTP-dependent phosphoenolpyruvate carboxykinase
VRIDSFHFGAGRVNDVPLVCEMFDWRRGLFLGAAMSCEKTAAAMGIVSPTALCPVRDAAVLRLPHGRRLLRPRAEERAA